jgi:hypothetical protein
LHIAWRATKQRCGVHGAGEDRVATPTKNDKSLATLVSELWELVVSYAKQETLDPLKSLGRFAKYGFVGSLLLGIGFLLLAMAGLRALQEETLPHWSGNWSWVPYLLTMAGAVLVAILLGFRITSDKRRADRRRRSAGKGA